MSTAEEAKPLTLDEIAALKSPAMEMGERSIIQREVRMGREPIARILEYHVDMRPRLLATIEARDQRIAALVSALKPLAEFIRAFDAKPINLADEFYAIHAGTEWEASLRLSDLRKANATLTAEEKRSEQ